MWSINIVVILKDDCVRAESSLVETTTTLGIDFSNTEKYNSNVCLNTL